jgi:hypothetical protein
MQQEAAGCGRQAGRVCWQGVAGRQGVLRKMFVRCDDVPEYVAAACPLAPPCMNQHTKHAPKQ